MNQTTPSEGGPRTVGMAGGASNLTGKMGSEAGRKGL